MSTPPIHTIPNTPPQPPGWPDADDVAFMTRVYKRQLTWEEWYARSEHFAPSYSSTARSGSPGTKHK